MSGESINEEEWNFYFKVDAWTLREAILLLEGESPSLKPPYSKFYNSIEALAIRSNEAGLLPTICGSRLNWTTEPEVKVKPAKNWYYNDTPLKRDDVFYTEDVITDAGANIKIRPKVFLIWANSKGILSNSKLQDFFQNNCQEEDSSYSATNCTEDISPNEHRELNRLRKFKKKFPDLINQAVAAALYAGIMGTVREVTRTDLNKGVAMLGVGPLDIELTNQIWKALPLTIKKPNGRPRNVPEPTVCKRIRDAISRKAVSTDFVIDEVPTKEDDGEN